jgi:MFS family permease
MLRSLNRPGVMTITLAAAGILMVTMGTRQSFGLLISPINHTSGLGIATISLALAIGQFTWGAIQPVAGALADRFGPRAVLIGGLVVLAAGCAITPYATSGFGLVVSLGLLAAMGSGAGSFSVLIGAAAQRMPLEARGTASGVINAGGSFGQFVFAPILQKLIQRSAGWVRCGSLALLTLAALPLVGKVDRPGAGRPACCRTHRQGFAGRPCARPWRPQLPAAACRLLHLRLPHRLPGHPPAGRGQSVRPAARGRQLVAGDHRPGQHLRQPLRRCLRLQAIAASTCWPGCTARAPCSSPATCWRRARS